MWRTHPGIAIGLLSISCVVAVCVVVRATVLQRSKADSDRSRVAHWVRWATIGLVAESRKAIQGIRSVASVGCGLDDSLHAMMNGVVEEFYWGKTPPLTTSVVAEGRPKTVNSWVAEEVCRIAREALWNSLAHARAQRIEAEVAYSDRFLRLRFRDDGIGMDSEILKNHSREGYQGMTEMYERAKNIHARLSIWSRPGAGTEVELTIPAYIAYDATPSRGRSGRSKREEQAHHVERL